MIDANRVNEIFHDCLFRDTEIRDGKPIIEPLKGKGIMGDFGFHPNRIKSHEKEIVSFLGDLPDGFHAGSGGGQSFLNACDTKNGQQWTGLHQRMEQLFALGSAIGKVRYPLPKEMWSVLPGGMPYVTVDLGDTIKAEINKA